MLAALALMITSGAASAASPVRVASAAQFVATARACARHINTFDINVAAIESDGWKPLDRTAWPHRTFPEAARLFSRGDGVLLETIVHGPVGGATCIVFAGRAAGQTFEDVEQGLIAAFGVDPVYRQSSQRRSSLWAIDHIMFLLTNDKLYPDVMDITIGVQDYDTPITKFVH